MSKLSNWGGDINKTTINAENWRWVLRNQDGYEMFEISIINEPGTMEDILHLFKEAIEVGRKLAQKDIRQSLGIKERF